MMELRRVVKKKFLTAMFGIYFIVHMMSDENSN